MFGIESIRARLVLPQVTGGPERSDSHWLA
jgi:hypothetical protein